MDKPWNEYPEVCEFLAQFEPGVKFTTRNALVLDGGSRRGKTQFALSLVLARAGVEVNFFERLAGAAVGGAVPALGTRPHPL